MKKLSWGLCLLLVSCTNFVKLMDKDYYDAIDVSGKNQGLKVIFSHNINGETHPCGCRQHPLGGLPQVAGLLHQQRQSHSVIYVDTGDTFFISTNVPDPVRQSYQRSSQAVAEGLSKLGVNFFVPGDQDFAMGEDYLAQLVKKYKIPVLVSNFGDTSIPHRRWAQVVYQDQHIFFLGVLDPEVFFSVERPNLIPPHQAIESTLQEIEKEFPNIKNKKIILLSHSGIDNDRIIAKKFPSINWIVGAHSQSFTNYPVKEGNTQLVQVLSKNHYLGDITFSRNPQDAGSFKLLESSDEKAQLIPNNPWVAWLAKYKEELEQIQAQEQGLLKNSNEELVPFKTYATCINCHQKQGEFWQGTAHALAYHTLVQAKSEHNPSCIECHTLGYKDPQGFTSSHQVVQMENADQSEKYLAELGSMMKDLKSVRKTASSVRAKKSQHWIKLDEKFAVTHNFANVQCLHCHQKADDHPFDVAGPSKVSMQQNCVNCHTAEQSPEWYNKDSKGIATTLNEAYVSGMIKKVACPAN